VTPAPAEAREGRQRLFRLVAAPLAWAAHFALTYATVAVWCARVAGREGPLGHARTAVAAYTAVALVVIAAVAHDAWTRYRLGGDRTPLDADTGAGRHRFLGLAAFLLAGLSAVATLYAALAVALIGSCR
jgi:hypothetical protein